ncbi:MAG: MFS transporter [Actinobacteria bacterium]|jgi:predicted MFS family arabinose efflux permease|nr:MFS transporter [Actinomycetota bacterium]NDC12136.1 MFS transporter [Actinomycetota bacterium]NDD17594.1 MFS transporter [Acidimicrobiia bacterium]NDD61517.1 MFS transporter [Actinomycetota bacterium]NDF71730.1 MFS transporter [Actinomycetota bacterium]
MRKPNVLRDNRDLRLLFVAQNLSFMGDWFTFVALAGLVQDVTDSALLVSLLLVAFSLPSFLASPLGGPVADRYDRRQVLIVVSVLQAIAACGLLFIGTTHIWLAFVSQGLIAAFAAFVRPAVEAAVPNLARDPDELRRANALFGSSWGVMLAVGAGLGGIFAETFGRQAAFIADIATFVIAAGLIALVKRPMQEDRGPVRAPVRPIADMREALDLARRDSTILALLASKMTFAIGAGVVSQLAVYAADAFAAGDAGRGYLLGARGIGSGIGPIIGARFAKGDLRRVLLVCGVAGMVFSVGYMAAAAAPILLVAAVSVMFAHLGGGAQWTLSTYGLQVRAPDEMRGRVLAGDFALITLSLALSSVAAGLVSEQVGARATVAIFGALAAATSLAYLLLTRRVRAELRSVA